jgi:putative membrane protein
MGFIWSILLLSVAVFIVAKMMPRIHIESFWTALIVALVYGIINALVGWLLALLALPLMIITFGLFKLVINAFLLWVTDKLLDDFEIDDIPTTLIAAVFITIIDSVLRWIF